MYFYMNANFYSYYNVIFWDSNTLYSKLHVASTIWITWVIRDVIDQNSVINCLFARQNFQKMRRYSYCIDVMKYYVLWVLIILIWWKCPQHMRRQSVVNLYVIFCNKDHQSL